MQRTLRIDNDSWLECCNIGLGLFAPLKGFMVSEDYRSVVKNMRLKNGHPWTIPVTLDVPEEMTGDIKRSGKLVLANHKGDNVAEVLVEDVFSVNYGNDIKKIFGTDDVRHPGIVKELSRSRFRVGGPVKVLKYEKDLFPAYSLTPSQTRGIFKKHGWKTVVGFQTRNPIHAAHEYLQRKALSSADGLFIHPLIGWKKKGDFSPLAVVSAYEKMVADFYPANRVAFGILRTPMRYAGPREAVFHALIRKNFGCTHFIVGRDHAGVGNYYGKYEAQELCKKFPDLGIEILHYHGPYYCKQCQEVVTVEHCDHDAEHILPISGTEIRRSLSEGRLPREEFMRKEIADVLIELHKEDKLFVGEDV
ncbi:MAG: sulfate adenylyltransferase [Candidatus Margulisbacteria bacterium]|nr:sulfate adenylyltransferase [Candidatus Margulisiibacteriota bacterium]